MRCGPVRRCSSIGGHNLPLLPVLPILAVLALAGPAQARPQQGASRDPTANVQVTGAVAGRVLCSDTQRPARFAEVTILPVQDGTGGEDSGPGFGGGRGRRGSTRTDLDGNYLVTNLPPGAYYATATATGYVSTLGAILARSSGAVDTPSLLAQLPQVQVSGSGTSTANLTLEKGAVIAGRVMWDDGSAAAGVGVNAVLSTAQNPLTGRRQPNGYAQLGFGAVGGNGNFAQTDDRGNFRLTGLAPGDYVVRANFAAPAPAGAPTGGFGGIDSGFGGVPARAVNITLYAPGKMRRTDAQTLTLTLGEERGDVVFTADLRALHSVAGRVSSAGDTQVHSGVVRLVDTQDTTLSRNAQLNADGTFTLAYVPAGTYTLSVPNASSATQQQGGGGRRGAGGNASPTAATTFQPLQETLTVTDSDLAGVNLTVVPATATSTSTTAGR